MIFLWQAPLTYCNAFLDLSSCDVYMYFTYFNAERSHFLDMPNFAYTDCGEEVVSI